MEKFGVVKDGITPEPKDDPKQDVTVDGHVVKVASADVPDLLRSVVNAEKK
jgi:hypothetical protein